MLGHARRIPLLALETESLENNYNDVLSARSTISAPSFKLFLSVCCYCGGRYDISRCLKIRLESNISSSDFGRLRLRPRWPLSCWKVGIFHAPAKGWKPLLFKLRLWTFFIRLRLSSPEVVSPEIVLTAITRSARLFYYQKWLRRCVKPWLECSKASRGIAFVTFHFRGIYYPYE